MELTDLTFQSRRNTGVILSKKKATDNTDILIIKITKLIDKKERKNYSDFKIVRKFPKSLLVEHYTYLSEMTFTTILLFIYCKTIEEFKVLTENGQMLEVGIGVKTTSKP
jgi:hypothetical protein